MKRKQDGSTGTKDIVQMMTFVIIAILGLVVVPGIADAWWDITYPYKNAINVSVSNSTDNHSICLNLTYRAQMQADFDDLRFVNGSDTELLDHWLVEYVASDWAYVCFMGNFTTNNGTQAYVYYGNAAATNTSNRTIVGRHNLTDAYFFNGNATDYIGSYHGSTNVSTVSGVLDRYGNTSVAVGLASASSQYVGTGYNTQFRNNFTFALWFRTNSTPATSYDIISKQQDTNRSFRTDLQASSIIEVGLSTSGTTSDYKFGKSSFLPGTWNFLVIRRQDNGSVDIFVNGTRISNNASSVGALAIGEKQAITFGAYGGAGGAMDRFFNGTLDDIFLYNDLLTDAEIRSMWAGHESITVGSLEALPTGSGVTVTIASPLNTTYYSSGNPYSVLVFGNTTDYYCNASLNGTLLLNNTAVTNNTYITGSLSVPSSYHYNFSVNCTNSDGFNGSSSVAFLVSNFTVYAYNTTNASLDNFTVQICNSSMCSSVNSQLDGDGDDNISTFLPSQFVSGDVTITGYKIGYNTSVNVTNLAITTGRYNLSLDYAKLVVILKSESTGAEVGTDFTNITIINSTHSNTSLNVSNVSFVYGTAGIPTGYITVTGYYNLSGASAFRSLSGTLNSTQSLVIDLYFPIGVYYNFQILDYDDNPVSGATFRLYETVNSVLTLVTKRTSMPDGYITNVLVDPNVYVAINVSATSYNPFYYDRYIFPSTAYLVTIKLVYNESYNYSEYKTIYFVPGEELQNTSTIAHISLYSYRSQFTRTCLEVYRQNSTNTTAIALGADYCSTNASTANYYYNLSLNRTRYVIKACYNSSSETNVCQTHYYSTRGYSGIAGYSITNYPNGMSVTLWRVVWFFVEVFVLLALLPLSPIAGVIGFCIVLVLATGWSIFSVAQALIISMFALPIIYVLTR